MTKFLFSVTLWLSLIAKGAVRPSFKSQVWHNLVKWFLKRRFFSNEFLSNVPNYLTKNDKITNLIKEPGI
jgi:hypothetical protein